MILSSITENVFYSAKTPIVCVIDYEMLTLQALCVFIDEMRVESAQYVTCKA